MVEGPKNWRYRDNEAKQRRLEDMMARYDRGESIAEIAAAWDLSHDHTRKIINDEWVHHEARKRRDEWVAKALRPSDV